MSKTKHSALFRHIERLQGSQPWGAVLDAGTGVNSLRWTASLKSERWTAVTGSIGEAERARRAIGAGQRTQDQLIVGNWTDPNLLQGDAYDTVLADYLLGAIDGFAPYFQTQLFARLRGLTRGVLYVTGLEPYVPAARPREPGARLIWEIGRFRDACVLLKGGMPYREYPSQWAAEQLTRAVFAVAEIKHFAVGYKERFVNAQITIALDGLEGTVDPALAQALKVRAEALRSQSIELITADGALRGCRNYVIAAKPIEGGA